MFKRGKRKSKVQTEAPVELFLSVLVHAVWLSSSSKSSFTFFCVRTGIDPVCALSTEDYILA